MNPTTHVRAMGQSTEQQPVGKPPMTSRGGVPISCGDLPIICRDVADAAVYGHVNANEHQQVRDTMADVSGFGRMRPDGAKIVELRKRSGLKQEVLADKAHISVRQLGEIERTSKTVHATTLTAIATALGATPREITLSTPDDEAPEKFGTLLKLKGTRSATDLAHLARSADAHGYLLKVDPASVEAATEMQEVMKIVGHYVTAEPDEFEKAPFGDIPRLARLHQLLENLRAGDVGVLAGTIVVTKDEHPELCGCGSDLGRRVLLFIFFVPIAVEEEVVSMPFILEH